MRLGWKVFLPISLAAVAIVAGILQYAGPFAALFAGQVAK
jgi:NADH:ubiquinone oxidoreductase subunit H